MAFIIKERTNGEIIADAQDHQNVRAFEGNWYFKPEVVNMQHLKVTDRTYTCPYKGVCYWIDLESADGSKTQNVAWVYREPKPTYEFIKDQIAFYTRPTSGTISETTNEPATAAS
ncbi:MAG: DUF427 domain-containing protein [Anaerolineae bacterium]|nr:DUF427 domain-containing protein [Anaerolineae bacterium]